MNSSPNRRALHGFGTEPRHGAFFCLVMSRGGAGQPNRCHKGHVLDGAVFRCGKCRGTGRGGLPAAKRKATGLFGAVNRLLGHLEMRFGIYYDSQLGRGVLRFFCCRKNDEF